MYCSNCGKERESNFNKFCKYCGFEVEKNNIKSLADYQIGKDNGNIPLKKLKLDTINLNKIEPDFIDRQFHIKDEKFNKYEISELRFKISSKLLYIVSSFIILSGLALYGRGQYFSFDTLFMGILYLILTFTFHKLRMSLMLGFLSLSILLNSLYSVIVEPQSTGILIIFIWIGLLLVTIQMFRSYKYIESTNKTVLKSIASSIFFIILFLVFLGYRYDNDFENIKTINFSKSKISEKKSSTWDKSFITRLRLQLETKYMQFYTKEYKPINDYELERYKIIALNIGECFVNDLQLKYPDYGIFEEIFSKNNDERAFNIISSIETNCIKRHDPKIEYKASY